MEEKTFWYRMWKVRYKKCHEVCPMIIDCKESYDNTFFDEYEKLVLRSSHCQICNSILTTFPIPTHIKKKLETKHNTKIRYGGYDIRTNKISCFPNCDWWDNESK